MQGLLENQHADVCPEAIFRTPLTDFDAIIALREDALPYPDRAIPGSTQNLSASSTGAEEEQDADDGLLTHKKARARLHSIPKGECRFCWLYKLIRLYAQLERPDWMPAAVHQCFLLLQHLCGA